MNKKKLLYTLVLLALLAAVYWITEKGNKQSETSGDAIENTSDSFVSSKRSKNNTGTYTPTEDVDELLQVDLPAKLNDEVIHYKAFTISYNSYYRVPNYVAYELTNTMVSMADSRDAEQRDNYKFEKDNKVKNCADWWEYKESNYTRGHMAPAMDMRWDKLAMSQCFLMSNICPQVEGLNDGEWRHLEEAVHNWARSVKRLLVFSGPIYSNDMQRIGKRKDIAVPKSFFKVIYAPDQNRAIAFIMDNAKLPKSWTNYATTIDEVERRTGYDFLEDLDDEVEDVVESKQNIKDWPKYYPRR